MGPQQGEDPVFGLDFGHQGPLLLGEADKAAQQVDLPIQVEQGGAQGGHPDTAAGAKCTIVITPLIQGRSPAVCTDVTTVTTPGETVDVIVTDYGIAVNPARPDLFEAAEKCGAPVYTIEQLRDIAYSIVGVPEQIRFDERVVGIVEARDGTIMDVVCKRKEFTFD